MVFASGLSAAAQPVSADDQPESGSSSADRGTEGRPFSLLDFGETISIGFSLGYFSYKEYFDPDEALLYPRELNQPVPLVVGTPKSTEYGDLFGLHAGGTFYSWENRLFFRPGAAVLLGYGNTYDGSSQGQPTFDSAGNVTRLDYYPARFKKNNIFLWAGGDVGYSFPYFKIPVVMYTGLAYKLWYRNLMDYQGQLYYSSEFSNSETYHWFSVPLGILITKPMTWRYVAGVDARVEWMFYGAMSVSMNTGAADSSVSYPTVTLGNRASVRIELFLQKRTSDHLSTKFAPYFLFYGFGKSNTAVATTISQSADGKTNEYAEPFYEPFSNSFLVGITFSMEFLNKGFIR
jgi:hypothetical protein